LKPEWQKHVLASSGYLELGMFDDAVLALEEIKPRRRPLEVLSSLHGGRRNDRTEQDNYGSVSSLIWSPKHGERLPSPSLWLAASSEPNVDCAPDTRPLPQA
jgi:hypothetical protein